MADDDGHHCHHHNQCDIMIHWNDDDVYDDHHQLKHIQTYPKKNNLESKNEASYSHWTINKKQVYHHTKHELIDWAFSTIVFVQ